jgi:Arm DNA-binding domain
MPPAGAPWPGNGPTSSSTAGLALWVSPAGARVWRLYYRVAGRPQTRSFGPYPENSLAKARSLRDGARDALRDGTPPERRRAVTLRDACTDYGAGRADTSERYRRNAMRALELNLWPALGERDVASLTRAEVLAELLRLERRQSTTTCAGSGCGWPWGWHGAWSAATRATTGRRQSTQQKHLAAGRWHHAAVELHEVGALWARLDMEGGL